VPSARPGHLGDRSVDGVQESFFPAARRGDLDGPAHRAIGAVIVEAGRDELEEAIELRSSDLAIADPSRKRIASR
jgi:hypothetical protein